MHRLNRKLLADEVVQKTHTGHQASIDVVGLRLAAEDGAVPFPPVPDAQDDPQLRGERRHQADVRPPADRLHDGRLHEDQLAGLARPARATVPEAPRAGRIAERCPAGGGQAVRVVAGSRRGVEDAEGGAARRRRGVRVRQIEAHRGPGHDLGERARLHDCDRAGHQLVGLVRRPGGNDGRHDGSEDQDRDQRAGHASDLLLLPSHGRPHPGVHRSPAGSRLGQ